MTKRKSRSRKTPNRSSGGIQELKKEAEFKRLPETQKKEIVMVYDKVIDNKLKDIIFQAKIANGISMTAFLIQILATAYGLYRSS